MALTTDFNVDPYYDDYSESKNFYRVLFRPGYAVQAREVTQLQTILQKQIERNGRHTFEEGSIVLGCELNYDNEVKSVKLETQFAGADLSLDGFANGIVVGGTSNARGRIVATAASTAADQPTLMFHYLNNNTFNDGETLTVEGSTTQANTVSSAGASGITGATSNGAVVSVDSGVFYVGGYFVFKDAETLVLEKYSSTPSYRVGLQVSESVVTSDADSTLLDPAQGAYNYAAQGANRFKISLALAAKPTTATDPIEAVADDNFYQLLKVDSGLKIQEVKYPVYSELEKTLARRTFDESGDYTVTPFNLQLTSHQGITGRTAASGVGSTMLGTGTLFQSELSSGDIIYLSGTPANTATIDTIASNTSTTLTGAGGSPLAIGVATANQSIHFESKFSAGLDPGKAYVKGYEYESIATKFVTVDKGRDTFTVNTFSLNTAFGNKLYVKQANGYFDVSKHDIVTLYCANTSTQNVSGTGSTNFPKRNSQTKIGTARVRDMDWYSASGNTGNTSHSHSDYVLYLYDVRTSNNKSGIVTDSIYYSEDTIQNESYSDSTGSTFEPRLDVVRIGTANTGHVASNNYHIGGTATANGDFDKLSKVEGAYVGATVKVVTPNLNMMIGEDAAATGNFNISLENPNNTDYNAEGGGVIILEDQAGISNTTYTRTVVGQEGSGTSSNTTLILDSDMTRRPSMVANSTGGAEASLSSTFDVQFQLKDAESVAVCNTTVRQSSAEVDELSRYNSIPTANAVLKESQYNSLIFALPDQPVEKVANVSWTFKRTISTSASTAGLITINLSGETFPSTGTLSTSLAEELFVVVANTASSAGEATTGVKLSRGQYVSLSGADGVDRPVVINEAGTQALIYCNTGSTSPNVFNVTYTAKKVTSGQGQAGSVRAKSLAVGNTTYSTGSQGSPAAIQSLDAQVAKGQFVVTAPTREVGTKIELPVSDVFNIVKVVDSGSTSTKVTTAMLSATANNITNSYSLDTGQTDNYYGHSSISLKPGQQPPNGQILIIYDRFAHPSSGGFFSANSYPATGSYDGGTKTFSYSAIPKYTSAVTGEEYRLSDVLDFRPIVKTNTGGTSGGATAIAYDFATSTDALDSDTILVPDSDTSTTLDYNYYLPRIDKLVLTRDRQFEVIKGKADTNPVAPPDDEDSMTLYTLNIPAYTFALTDIETRYIDNKRFTMRDIGKIEKRVERLEYFTSLSLLEKETEARDITSDGSRDSLFNTTGSRFKNGILVDPFAGHSIGDVTRDEYNSAIHFAEKQLRPAFFSDNFRFNYNSASSNNATKTGDLITLPFTSSTFVEQPMTSSTISVNPFNIVNFIGNVKLDPPSDTWFDSSSRPDVTVNMEGHHDNWSLSPAGGRVGFGSQWDDWSVNWTGKQINPEPKAAVSNAGSSTVRTRSTLLTAQNKTKFGVQADNPVETIVKTVGNRIIDASVVPYVRSQRVSFSTKGLKPLSNVYVFIGDTDMSANTEGAKKLGLTSANGAFQEGEVVKDSANNQGVVRITSNTVSNVTTMFITDINGNSSATHSSPITSRYLRITNSAIGFAVGNVVTGVTSGANGTIGSITANTRGILTSGVSHMKTNDQGEIAGDIDIPAGTFRSGDRLVRFTDHANNELASTTTVAESFFKSKGLLQSRERLIISTREPIIRRESIGDEGVTTDTTSRQSSQTNWLNPMAQSIVVDPSTYPMGLFLKDVVLWFSSKDVNLPVSVQIRPMVNGFPSSSVILPFSEVTLNPDSIQTSATANAATSNTTTSTTFTFDSPVYLTPDEYAIVVVSNSPEYKLYTASHGENATGTTRKISKQPFVGSFFRPQNAGTWEAKKEEFLMMRVNRCNFSGTGGSANFARFDSSANAASGNTANVLFQTFKTTSSTIQFSNTTTDFTYQSYNTSNTAMGYSSLDMDQNIILANTRQLTANTLDRHEGQFIVNCAMSTSNSHVSPVIDVDRLSLVTIENDIDDAVISANDITITTVGAGYTNSAPNAYSATFTAPDISDATTATANVFVELTLPVDTAGTYAIASPAVSIPIWSSNSDYTVSSANPGKFIIGEGVRTVKNNSSNTSGQNSAQGIVAEYSGTGVGSGTAYGLSLIHI